MNDLSGAELDTLIALVERGPLEDGHMPSKSARNSLLSSGLAAQVVINQECYFYAATSKGLEWYLNNYNASTILDARTTRIKGMKLP